jgi:hypothetical protein
MRIFDHCFTSNVAVTSYAGIVTINTPSASLSDVTSSRKTNHLNMCYMLFFIIVKPTINGEVCTLPYKIGHLTWDMYFCNSGHCPTATSEDSRCTRGSLNKKIFCFYVVYLYFRQFYSYNFE